MTRNSGRLALAGLLALAVAAVSASPALLAAAPRKSRTRKTLSDMISRFLQGNKGQHRKMTAGVAAVRGGNMLDKGEDLDQRLLDRANLLRGNLLGAAPSAADETALKGIYDALSASKLVQALELPLGAEDRAEAIETLKEWAAAPRSPAPPEALKAALGAAEPRVGAADPSAGGSKAVLSAGWADYCRALAPDQAAAAAPGAIGGQSGSAAPETAKLEENLTWLQKTRTEKVLSAEESAKATFLEGMVYGQLADAELKAASPPLEASVAAVRGGSAPAGALPEDPSKLVTASRPAADAGPFDPKAVYGRASKSVVLILCAAEDGGGEIGSGSIISPGRVLTNAHVVIRDSSKKPWPTIRVYFKPAKMTGDPKQDLVEPRTGRVTGWDSALDLATVEVEEAPEVAPLAIGDPGPIEPGERVAAIGHPEQGGLWTLTTGVVSTLVANLGGVQGKNAFQTDASINRGNSGGPLLNGSGDIIGVNTLMSRRAADGLAITAVNFAVKADVVKDWLAKGSSAAAAPAPAEEIPVAREKPAPKPEAPESAAEEPEEASPKPAAEPEAVPEGVEMVTESKPYSIEDTIAAEIQEMEELGEEMHQEFLKRKPELDRKEEALKKKKKR